MIKGFPEALEPRVRYQRVSIWLMGHVHRQLRRVFPGDSS